MSDRGHVGRENAFEGDSMMPLPSALFDDVTRVVAERRGAEWLGDEQERSMFRASMLSAIEHIGGLHSIPSPEGSGPEEFPVWIEFGIDDLSDLDDTAYQVLALVSGDFLFVTREFLEHTVVYRFVTNTPGGGFIGRLMFTGPYVKDFVHLFRLKGREGRQYHA